MPREFHLGIYEKCVQERRRAATLPGRGRLQGGQEASHVAALDDFIFPSVPELGTVYASPKMRGATASLVGEDFVMHPHRHMHSGMGGMDQNCKIATLSRLVALSVSLILKHCRREQHGGSFFSSICFFMGSFS